MLQNEYVHWMYTLIWAHWSWIIFFFAFCAYNHFLFHLNFFYDSFVLHQINIIPDNLHNNTDLKTILKTVIFFCKIYFNAVDYSKQIDYIDAYSVYIFLDVCYFDTSIVELSKSMLSLFCLWVVIFNVCNTHWMELKIYIYKQKIRIFPLPI